MRVIFYFLSNLIRFSYLIFIMSVLSVIMLQQSLYFVNKIVLIAYLCPEKRWTNSISQRDIIIEQFIYHFKMW